MNLTWTDNATNESGFRVQRCQGAGCTAFALVATLGANATGWTNSGLPASTSYSYRVTAYNGAGSSAFSNAASATTATPPAQAPVPPSNLTGRAVSTTRVDLSWRDRSSNETGFSIWRCAGTNCANLVQVATVGANVRTFSDTVGTRGAYTYRVKAIGAAASSGYSNRVTVQV